MYAIRNNAVQFSLFANNTDFKGKVQVDSTIADDFEAMLIPFAPLHELSRILKVFWDAQISGDFDAINEDMLSSTSRLCEHTLGWLSNMLVRKQYFANEQEADEH